jgi:hypothetical protein
MSKKDFSERTDAMDGESRTHTRHGSGFAWMPALMHACRRTATATAIALLFLFLLPFGAGAQGAWDYEKEMAEDAAMLVKLGLIKSAGEKPDDYRTEANPMGGKFTNLATVPELFLYWSNTGKKTYR